MHVSRRARTLSLAFTGGVPLLLALSLHGQPAPAPSGLAPGTPQQVADALDKIAQPRFQDVTAGRFGVSRMMPAANGHEALGSSGSFRANTPTEAALLARADAFRRTYLIAFLHCRHVPGVRPQAPLVLGGPAAPNVRPRMSMIFGKQPPNAVAAHFSGKTIPEIQEAALSALPAAMKGRAAQTSAGEWALFLRPVAASKDACLGCHSGAKRGDTLGVMVYAVSKN